MTSRKPKDATAAAAAREVGGRETSCAATSRALVRTAVPGLGAWLLLIAGPAVELRAAPGPAEEGAAKAGASRVVATWQGGRIEHGEYRRWLLAHGLDDTPESLREMVFVRSLADAAEERLDPANEQRVEFEVESRRQEVLLRALRGHLATGIEVSDEEIEQLRSAHPQAFIRPRKLFLRNIFKPVDGDPAAVRERMQAIRRRLLEGEDFEELARQESASQSRFRGGLLGFVDPEELPAEVASVVKGLQPGQLSEPVLHGGGYTIFLCEDVREAQVPTPDEVRAKLRANLERQRGAERWASFQESLIEGVELHLDAVAHLDAGSPPSDGTVLEMAGYRLDLDGAVALAAARFPERPFEELSREEIRSMLSSWAAGIAASRRAVELGLHREEKTAATLEGLRTQVLARRELVRRIDQRLEEPTDRQLREWFEAHPGPYQQASGYELAVIHFGKDAGSADPAAAERERVELALEVARRLEAGELEFEEAARRHSTHPSASRGGHLGWLGPQKVLDWGPTVSRALRALKPGEQSGLLRAESGLWIFRLLDRRRPRPLTFDEARERVRADLRRRTIQDLERVLRSEQLEALGAELLVGPPESSPEPAARPVVLRWSTASEFERYGYHVYRGRDAEGPFERLTDEVVPGAGTTDVPQHYRFEDTEVEAGATYYYYVEAVSTNGRRQRFTPLQAIEAQVAELADPAP